MDEQERMQIERAQAQLRACLPLLPDKKDDRITLIREFIGAEDEGAAYDVLLIVGDAQKAGPEFWDAATKAGKDLDAEATSPWLSPEAQVIWGRQCEG